MPRRIRHRGLRTAVPDQHGGLGVGEDRVDVGRRQPVVDGRQRRAEQSGGEQGLEERRVVRTEPSHPVPAPHAEPVQTVCQAPDADGEFRV